MKITPFQAIVLVIFGAALVAGIIILATTQSGGKKNNLPVVIWGTISDDHFRNAVEDITEGNSGYKITYIEKRSENFDQELVEALASGVGPDAILFPHDLIMRHRDKILFLPYSSLPARTFMGTFIQ